jgi:hypothetical protein
MVDAEEKKSFITLTQGRRTDAFRRVEVRCKIQIQNIPTFPLTLRHLGLYHKTYYSRNLQFP